jgi:hypothetical protein
LLKHNAREGRPAPSEGAVRRPFADLLYAKLGYESAKVKAKARATSAGCGHFCRY